MWRSPDKVKRNKIVQPVEHGGLNMIDTQLLFYSLIANWINKILNADPNLQGLNVRFNFDDNVLFPKIEELTPF